MAEHLLSDEMADAQRHLEALFARLGVGVDIEISDDAKNSGRRAQLHLRLDPIVFDDLGAHGLFLLPSLLRNYFKQLAKDIDP